MSWCSRLSFRFPRSRLPLLALALAAGAVAGARAADEKAAQAAHIDVARSAQLLIDATESSDTVAFWIRHASDRRLVGGQDVKVTVDAKPQAVTPRTDGSFTMSTDDLRGKEPKPVEIIVGHDGIREILTGQLPPPPEGSGTGMLGGHNQLAWWIINLAVLLIGAFALSRRKSY